ncbi:MAG TPA: PQQ-binding-like beta-propeller repeat protein, partial [Nitriliruptorales bacterium]|nr:PQQ-binding-like beta-propeller repeat protein [Nitriliruptorales bacterium]
MGAGIAALVLAVIAGVAVGGLRSSHGPGGVSDLTGVAWTVTLPRPDAHPPSGTDGVLDEVTAPPPSPTAPPDPPLSPWPPPVVTAGRVVAATLDGPLTVLDAADGVLAWRFAPGRGVQTAPAVSVVQPAPNPSAGAPRVYLGTGEEVVALDLERGRMRWRTRLRPDPGASPVATPSLVVFTEQRGVFAVTAASGSFAWRYLPRGGGAPGGPVAHDHRVHVGATDGTLAAIESATGRRRWVLDAGGRLAGSAALHAGVV